MDNENGTAANTEKATFGAGCFWQVEHTFKSLDGVVDTAVGYEGGTTENPSYEDVCTGRTGHVEVCQVTYDPERISYEALLDAFWQMHDPTQVDRQGPDFGTQYRSVIFVHSDDQQLVAADSKARTQAKFRDPIATSIEPAKTFWMAEGYHQCYLENRSTPGKMLRSLIGL